MRWTDLKKKGNEKTRRVKKTLYDRLINYIAKPIKKSVGGFKDKSLFKINTPNQTVYPRKQNIKKPFISEEKKEKNKDRIIRDIWKLFETEEEKGERK